MKRTPLAPFFFWGLLTALCLLLIPAGAYATGAVVPPSAASLSFEDANVDSHGAAEEDAAPPADAGAEAAVKAGRQSAAGLELPKKLPKSDAEAELLFREGNEAFLAGQSAEAIEAYNRLVEAGYGDAKVQHNLGTAHLQLGHLGHAIVAFERALILDPWQEDAQSNLSNALKKNVDKLVGAEAGAPFFERLARRLPPAITSYAFVAIWCMFFLLLSLRAFGWMRGPLRLGAVLLCATLLVVFSLLEADLIWYRDFVDRGVVVSKVASVRKGPGPRFDVAFELHEGMRVRLQEDDGPYLRIRLLNGLEGWMRRTEVESIALQGVGS